MIKAIDRQVWEDMLDVAYSAKIKEQATPEQEAIIGISRHLHELEKQLNKKKVAKLLMAKVNGHSQ